MKQLIEDIAKALVDIPEEVSVREVLGEQVTVLELKVAPSDLGQGDRQTGPHRTVDPHHSGRGRDEAEPALHAGNSGVSSPETAWVTVARLGKTRGNRGEITALALSDRPERYQALGQVYLCGAGAPLPRQAQVEYTWFHNGTLIFKFQGVDTHLRRRTAGGRWRYGFPSPSGRSSKRASFSNPTWWAARWWTGSTGGRLGRVEAWQDGGGSGLLVVEGGLLIPFARSICVEIDVQSRRIAVELPEGLKELNAS